MGPLGDLSFLSVRLAVVLFCVCLPLTVLWGYSLAHCLRGAARDGGPMTSPTEAAPLDDLTWALLILLSGWFGALAYFAVVLLPRLQLRPLSALRRA